MIYAAIFLMIALTGCSSLGFVSRQSLDKQIGLTALMLADTAQTVTIARSSCLYEANPIAAGVFGSEHPSPQRVLLINAVYIAAHWAAGSWLDRKAESPVDLSVDAITDVRRRQRWRVLRSTYQWATLIGHGAAVTSNAANGIKPFSSYHCGSQ